jgi:hypothetical protein
MRNTTAHAVAASGLALLLAGWPAGALPAAAGNGAPGGVLALTGTPLQWVFDEQGVAHYAADPQALEGKAPAGTTVRPVTKAELRDTPRGAPFVTAAPVRYRGEVYIPQFPVKDAPPILLHVQSADDLALLGLSGDAGDQLVLDADTWEQRYGYALVQLPADELRFYPAPSLEDDSGSHGRPWELKLMD